MIINIFTGGKGGIGKTLNALCCSVYYLKNTNNAGVNIIDLNYTNPDLFKILYGQSLKDSDSANAKGFVIKDIGKGTEGSNVICKKNLFAVPHGNLGIWREIVDVVESSGEKKVLVIDSNFNIASLLYLTDADETRQISEMIKKSKIQRIRIWLVWSFNILADIGEYDRFLQEKSVKSFEEISEGKFKEKRDLIHILNPYKYYRENEYKTIDDLIKDMVERLGERGGSSKEAITFHQLVEHFTKAFKASKRSQSGAFRDLLRRINESYRELPFNVCFLPFYRKKRVQNYIENLSSKPPQGLDGLIKDIHIIYDSIATAVKKVDLYSTNEDNFDKKNW
jgi:Rad3-related DNA helicase